jgi:hypothetical protein
MTYDLEAAFLIWGYLQEAPPELVELRKSLFDGAAHDYNVQRDVADRVPDHTLAMAVPDVRARVAQDDWRTLVGVVGG